MRLPCAVFASLITLAACGDPPPAPVVAPEPAPAPIAEVAARPEPKPAAAPPPPPAAELVQIEAAPAPAKMPKVEIASPAKNEVLKADKAAALTPKLKIKDFELGAAGDHLCVMLDRGPCKKVTSLADVPALGAFGPLDEGAHVLVALARHGSNESVKPSGKATAFAATTFFVGKRGPVGWKEGSPMLIVSVEPSSPASSEGVLIDCYVANAEIGEGKYVVHASVGGPELGPGLGLRATSLAPFRLKNVQPGEHLFRFSLHHYGASLGPSSSSTTVSFTSKPVEGPYAVMQRTFLVTR